jgi:hypothetical protein
MRSALCIHSIWPSVTIFNSGILCQYFVTFYDPIKSRGSSSISIQTGLFAGQPGLNSWQIQWWDFSLCCVQTSSETHPASYPMGTGGSFPGGKEAGAWSWPLTSVQCRGQEYVELYVHSPNTLNGVVLSWKESTGGGSVYISRVIRLAYATVCCVIHSLAVIHPNTGVDYRSTRLKDSTDNPCSQFL